MTLKRFLLALAVLILPVTAEAYPTSLLYLTGQGDRVTENIVFPACYKAVLKWRVTQGKPTYLGVTLHSVDTKRSNSLVIAAYIPSGEALVNLKAGTYFLEIHGLGDGWTLELECRD